MLTVVVALQKHTGSHSRAALSLQFIIVCLPPAPLLCTAFGVWTDQPLCSVMPHSPGEQANEGGDRWKEEQQNESQRTREIICCPCVSFLFGAEYQWQDGGGGAAASLDYICFIHVVDSHVILHWSMANCSLGKGHAALQSRPHPPLHPRTVLLFCGC